MRVSSLSVRLVRAILLPVALLSERLGNRFYIGLAVVIVAVALYSIGGDHTGGMKHQAYDLIMKSRFRAPPADPDIVLIDIDEATLAAMAPEYGRWPWPRSVMAEITEGLTRQQPAAIVFDVTFSDLDTDHLDADRYFRDVIKRTSQTFFAMIRLNPINDEKSELKMSQLPGVVAVAEDAPADATVAVVLPYFWDVLDDRRLGTNNLYTDDDGIARRYHVYRDTDGWRIYSLPANVVAALGGEPPERSDILLNWRGKPLAYRTLPFHELYASLLKQQGGRPAGEFTGKIIVIGSTAPSLFDLKPTPVAQNHPGVEILMTAIDNLKNGDYLTELPQGFYMLVTVIALVALAIAFVYNVDPLWLTTLFTLMQTAFLVITYLFLNYTTWFVDLTAPFTAVLAFFFVARLYHRTLLLRRNGHPLYSRALDPGQECQALLLCSRYTAIDRKVQRRINRVLQRHTGLTRYGAAAPRLFSAAPLINSIYTDTVLFYWLVPPERTCAALRDLLAMLDHSVTALRKHHLHTGVYLVLHGVRFRIDPEGEWRDAGKTAFIEALTLTQHPMRGTLTRTEAFAEVCELCPDVQVPPVLAQSGLHCGVAAAAS